MAGKGCKRRKGANDKAYADNYDAIFGKGKSDKEAGCYSLTGTRAIETKDKQ